VWDKAQVKAFTCGVAKCLALGSVECDDHRRMVTGEGETTGEWVDAHVNNRASSVKKTSSSGRQCKSTTPHPVSRRDDSLGGASLGGTNKQSLR